MSASIAGLYAAGLGSGRLLARGSDGTVAELPVGRWLGPVAGADARVLARAAGPVLDVGCGPGRHVTALARQGVLALGVDIAPAAIGLARSRGAPVMLGSVFDPIPGAGYWRTALLLDGNLGIGGHPASLLRRLRALLHPEGIVICELEAPASRTQCELFALEDAGGRRSGWFRWARVGADRLERPAAAAGLEVQERWRDQGRWFALLGPGSHHTVSNSSSTTSV